MGDEQDKPGAQKAPTAKAKPPQLPPGTPADMRDFVSCKNLTVTIKSGKVGWLPLPETLKKIAPPELKLAPGAQAGSVTITISVGFVSVTVEASVNDGQL